MFSMEISGSTQVYSKLCIHEYFMEQSLTLSESVIILLHSIIFLNFVKTTHPCLVNISDTVVVEDQISPII